MLQCRRKMAVGIRALTALLCAVARAAAAPPLGVFDGPSDGLFDGAAVGLPSGCQSDWVAVSGAGRTTAGVYRKLDGPAALNGTGGRPSYRKTSGLEQRFIFFADSMWVQQLLFTPVRTLLP